MKSEKANILKLVAAFLSACVFAPVVQRQRPVCSERLLLTGYLFPAIYAGGQRLHRLLYFARAV